MLLRAAVVWLLLLVIAIAAGALRTGLLEPRIGEGPAHIIGTLGGVGLFALTIWVAVGWITPALARRDLLRLGIGWLAATVIFEFSFGRYVLGKSWSSLLADYNIFAGRLWVLVLLTVLLMPLLAGELRRKRAGQRFG